MIEIPNIMASLPRSKCPFRELTWIMNVVCLACLSSPIGKGIHGLATPSPSPTTQPSSTSSSASILGGWQANLRLDSLMERNTKPYSPPKQADSGEVEHQNPISNLFHHFFSKHHPQGEISDSSTPSLPGVLSNFTFAIPNIHLPDIPFPSSRMFSESNLHETFRHVGDFDVGLAKDIEEALLLANNHLDIMTESSDGRGRDNSYERKDSSKSALFNENNVADWDLVNLKQNRYHQRKQHGNRSESHVLAREAKSSLFQETNAANEKLRRHGQRNAVDAQIDNYAVPREVNKLSLFQETNVAEGDQILSAPKFRSHNNHIHDFSIDNHFANAADVKGNHAGTRNSSMGYDRQHGLNTKNTEHLLNGSDVRMRNARNQDTRHAMRHKMKMSKEQEVDAITATAQAAWDKSSHHLLYSLNRGHTPQQQDTVLDRRKHYSRDILEFDGYGVVDDEDGERGDFSHHKRPSKSVIGETTQANWREENRPAHVSDDEASNGSVSYNTSSRKIFITERALELARSLQFDVKDIFQFKMNQLKLKIDDRSVDIESATVTESDVRDYLDQRYEKLISKVSMNNRDHQESPRRNKKANSIDRRTIKFDSDSKSPENRVRIDDSVDRRDKSSNLRLWPHRMQQYQQQQQQQLQPQRQNVNVNNHQNGTPRTSRQTDRKNKQRSDDGIMSSYPRWKPLSKIMNP